MADSSEREVLSPVEKKRLEPWHDIFLLEPRVRQYDWGGGVECAVARLSRRPGLTRYAELWLGAHPGDPALAVHGDSKELLHEVIARNPLAMLGADVCSRFGHSLPYLFKVLSIGDGGPLSLQAHPDARTAVILHQRDPRNYPDPYHKPELAVALSRVELLSGFRPLTELHALMREHQELEALLPREAVERVREAVSSARQVSRALQGFYRAIVVSDSHERAGVALAVYNRIRDKGRLAPIERLYLHLFRSHGGEDVGVLSSLLLNYASLEPGEGIFIGPNTIHAYVSGELVECMSSSDNVVRAGLTRKFQDILTLVEMLHYESKLPEVVRSTTSFGLGAARRFPTPAQEFQLDVIRGERLQADLSDDRGPRLVFLLEGEGSVVSSGRFLRLQPGDGVFVPDLVTECRIRLDYGTAFIVRVPANA